MTVFAIIVTYGDRYILLEEAVKSLLAQSIAKIIIVDNNSTLNSRIKLQNLEKNYSDKISVIYLDTNTGSATGYKIGIEYAIGLKECQFVWLLDDDNVPCCDALQVLKSFWTTIDYAKKEELMSLVSFRKYRLFYPQVAMEISPKIVLGRKNIYRSFHVADIIRKAVDSLLRTKNESVQCIAKEYSEICVAPYGGMFFNIKLIKTIGYPNEHYYLYSDDLEFSYRVIKNGGKMFLIAKSIVEDIDPSWHARTDGFAFSRIAKDHNYVRLYYSVRNRVYFEKIELMDNWFIYSINMFIYSVFVLGVALSRLRFKNIKIYFTAVYHGLSGKMGRNDEYVL